MFTPTSLAVRTPFVLVVVGEANLFAVGRGRREVGVELALAAALAVAFSFVLAVALALTLILVLAVSPRSTSRPIRSIPKSSKTTIAYIAHEGRRELSKATRERLDGVGLLAMIFVSEVAAEGVEELAKIFTPYLGMPNDEANDWAAFFEVTEVARRCVVKRRCLHVRASQHALASLSIRLQFDAADELAAGAGDGHIYLKRVFGGRRARTLRWQRVRGWLRARGRCLRPCGKQGVCDMIDYLEELAKGQCSRTQPRAVISALNLFETTGGVKTRIASQRTHWSPALLRIWSGELGMGALRPRHKAPHYPVSIVAAFEDQVCNVNLPECKRMYA